MTATMDGMPVELLKLLLSFPVEGQISMQTSHFLHSQLQMLHWHCACVKLQLHLCNLMILAEPGFRCFASMTPCVFC